MTSSSSFPRTTALLAVAAAATVSACGKEGGGTGPAPRTGLSVVAGGGGSDTIFARRAQALVVEVRDSRGRLQPQLAVQFTVGVPADTARQRWRGLALCSVTDAVCDPGDPNLTGARAEITDGQGRATVVVRHGAVAGPVWVQVRVPELGLLDSVQFTTRPGPLRSVWPTVRDTMLVVGASFPLALIGYDRAGNLIGPIGNALLAAGNASVQVQSGRVTAAAVGNGFVIHTSATGRDTTWVTVVPTGRLAMVRGDDIVVMNYDGSAARTYPEVSGAWMFGMRPRWSPGGGRLHVHSGGPLLGDAHLSVIDVATGTVTALPSSAAEGAQYFPDVSRNWIYFTARSASGAFTVWRMRPDGSALAPAPATSPTYTNYFHPALSPDSSKLALTVVEGSRIGMRVFDAATGAPVSPFIADAAAPVWAPDGQWIAYNAWGGGALRVARPDGSQARTVSTVFYSEYFDWSADGQWLVASNNVGLSLVRVTNGERLLLPSGYGDWQPAVER